MEAKILERVEDGFEIGTISSAEPVEKGVLSQNWFVTTSSGDFFLKRYRFEDEDRIKEIHAAKHLFFDAGIPVILPIRTTSGRSYAIIESRYYALFPRISGRQLERGTLTDAAIASMGKMLGRIHLAGKNSSLSVEKDMFRSWDAANFEEKAHAYLVRLAAIENPTPFDLLSMEDLQMKLALIERTGTSYESLDLQSDHLIHGDYLDHNLFFDTKDEVCHVFDFEKSQYAPRAFELVRSLVYSILDGEYDEHAVERGRMYIAAYREVYPISFEDFSMGMELFYQKSLRNIWIQKEYYDLKNERPAQFLVPDMDRIRYLSEHRSRLIEAMLVA